MIDGTYEVNERIWFKGEQVVVTTAPYALYGGEFQDAVNANGATVTVATPRQRDAEANRTNADHRELQDGFRRIRD